MNEKIRRESTAGRLLRERYRDTLTAREAILLLGRLQAQADRLMEKLKQSCGCCVSCEEDCPLQILDWHEDEVALPPDVLEAASIPADARLTVEADGGSGTVLIRAAEPAGGLAGLPGWAPGMLAGAGICMRGLDDLLRLEYMEGEA